VTAEQLKDLVARFKVEQTAGWTATPNLVRVQRVA
jgi:hypothetical protein